MSNLIEALKLAIDALQNNTSYNSDGKPQYAIDEANERVIIKCKEALNEEHPYS